MNFLFFYVAAMSIISFALYTTDKLKAKVGAWRIKESVLISLGILGGSPGALLGMLLLNHKTTRPKFWISNLFGAIIIAVAYYIFYTLEC